MTTTTWTSAPAGVLGQGSVDVRPYPGVVRPTPGAVHGAGLRADGFAAELRGLVRDDAARLRPMSGPVAVSTREPRFTAQKCFDRQSTQNDGTTLGIHSPGRPQS